jgi:hypothetical protein
VTKRGIIPSLKYGRSRRKRCSSTKRSHSMSRHSMSRIVSVGCRAPEG